MSSKRYPEEFKVEAVKQVTKQSLSFDFDTDTGYVLGHHYRINGVMSL